MVELMDAQYPAQERNNRKNNNPFFMSFTLSFISGKTTTNISESGSPRWYRT
uniref:Uncharacterized protein n=1 Tax=Salmonella enterica subsp. salamae TaxID=59202 RepID=I3W482_SALER|nr:hypothetical protein [Salmonella enterica subsp. salamae]